MRAGMYVYRAERWVNSSSCTGQELALEGPAEGTPLLLGSGLAFRVSLTVVTKKTIQAGSRLFLPRFHFPRFILARFFSS